MKKMRAILHILTKPEDTLAKEIIAKARERNCTLLLPTDVVVAKEFKANSPSRTIALAAVAGDDMILDVGAKTIAAINRCFDQAKTLVWNGPLGAFETPPFDAATTALAHAVAEATGRGTLRSVAGGGDTVSALRHAGVMERMSYVSTAGGAFLEWLEGKTLPGVAALEG